MTLDPRPTKAVGRRKFLRYAGLTLAAIGGNSLLACAPSPTPTAPPAPKAPPPPTQAPAALAPTAAAPAPTAAPKPTTAPAAPTAAAPARLTKVKFAFSNKVHDPGASFLWIANHPAINGFQEEGIDYEALGTEGGAQTLQLLLSRQVDFASGVQDPSLTNAVKGEILPLTWVFVGSRGIVNELIVKNSSPIREGKDLKGKKIGMLSVAAANLAYARAFVRESGLDPDKDVEYIGVGQGAQAATALNGGQVDAYVSWDFQTNDLQNLGFGLRILPQPDFIKGIYAGHVAAVHNDLLKEKPDIVARTMRGFAKSAVVYTSNPEGTIKMNWDLYPESKPKGISEADAIKGLVGGLKRRAEKLVPNIGPTTMYGEFNDDAWRRYVQFMAFGNVDPKRFYTNQFVVEANKFDEAAVRQKALSYK